MTRNNDDTRLEQLIGRVLFAGVTTSSACLVVGLGLSMVPGLTGAANWLLNAGLVILLATPVGRVVMSVAQYAIDRDWVFLALTLSVLAQLVASAVVAGH